ncbi:MAG: hypothetical protein ACJA05_000083 [Porticoccus sp.]|jgi:hypothetical protein|uniref:DUF4381 domain-containing protein n=1 Tax=Porticoccus sp. TaxID=2024853 RepID=UPI0039E4CEC9|tara:strand:- start:155465 stop:155956 length:492 start_codon:yes stop_codon:yes gene_type:complete
MNPQDPLSQLRDIHLPDPIGWWPPAPGWWLLALLLLSAMTYCLWRLKKRHQDNRYRREALHCLAELKQSLAEQPLEYCHAMLALLRRTAKTAYPDQALESELTPALLQRLNQQCRRTLFDETLQQQLQVLPYRADPENMDHLVISLHAAIKQWLEQHRRSSSC